MKRFLLVGLFGAFFLSSSAQVLLWGEDFSGEGNGATTGTAAGAPGGTWSVTTTPSGGAGRFSVNAGRFRIDNTGSEGVWSTNTFNIAAVGYAVITSDLIAFGIGLSDNDYVRFFYSVDGGPDVQFAEVLGTFISASTTTSVSAIVAGSTLRVTVKGSDNSFLGGIGFDDVSIESAPVIYSRKSGLWNDGSATGTWSLTGHTGTACSCRPLNTQVAIIGNSNTVTLPASQIAVGNAATPNLAPGALDVRSTGVLRYNTNNVTLGIQRGLLRVQSGGSINSSSAAITGEQISFDADIPAATLQVDAGGSVSVEDIVLGTAATNSHYLTGGGNLTITDDILINADNSSLTNNFTGTLSLTDRIEFQSGITGASFINGQPLTVTTLYFDDDNNLFTNNATLILGSIQGGAGDDNNTFTNSAGMTLNLGTVSENGSLDISNSGTINQSGNFTSVIAGSAFVNGATGIWNWTLTPTTGFDADMTTVLKCTTAGNTFNYAGAGNQTIINTTAGYYNLICSTSGVKATTAALVVGGDLTVQNSTTLDPGISNIDAGGNVIILNTGSIAGSGNLIVGGDWSAMSASSFAEGTRTVTFDGAAQTINNSIGTEAFYNLAITGSNTKSSSNIIDVNGNLTISSTAQLNVANDMNLAGNWSVTSTNANPFVEGTNTVTLDGSGAQIITTTLGAGETFYDLTITGAGVKSNNSLINIKNDLIVGGDATTQLSGSGSITIGGDWTFTNANAIPFAKNTRTVTFNGTAPQAINTSAAAGESFHNLTINNSSGTAPQIVPSDKITVTNALTMTDGIIQTTATNNLRILNGGSATIGNSGSYINGPMQFDMAVINTTRTLNFPIGKSGNYGAASVRIRHNAATAYTYTAEVIASSAATLNYTLASGTNRVSDVRYWDIRRGANATPLTTDNNNIYTSTSNTNAPQITLYYVAADFVTQPSNLTIVKNINGASVWNDIGAGTGAPAGSINSTGNGSANFTSFSYFTLANKTGGTNPLPVELVSFDAALENEQVLVKWRTSTERNNEFFTVERTFDLEKFDSIGMIAGNGTSNVEHAYSLIDSSPIYGRSYYRLKQTDYNRQFTYSKIAVVDYQGPRFANLNAYPSPSGGSTLNILVTGLKDQREVPIQIITATGHTVFNKTFQVVSPGTLSEEILFQTRLTQGVYIIRAGTTQYLTQKLVVE
ncbi:MAG: hypothetical protein ABI477_02610 [Chryseolinea sp.]